MRAWIRVRERAQHTAPTRSRTPTSAHTEELALIIRTLQIYNTTIHTSVGAETQEGRLLRGLAGWPAACSPGCQPLPLPLPLPLPICKTRVSFPSPSFSSLSFSSSLYPFPLHPFAPSTVSPFLPRVLFSSLPILRLLPCLPAGGQRAENRRAKYRATSGRGHLQIHRDDGMRSLSLSLFLSRSLPRSFANSLAHTCLFSYSEAGTTERLPGDTLSFWTRIPVTARQPFDSPRHAVGNSFSGFVWRDVVFAQVEWCASLKVKREMLSRRARVNVSFFNSASIVF